MNAHSPNAAVPTQNLEAFFARWQHADGTELAEHFTGNAGAKQEAAQEQLIA